MFKNLIGSTMEVYIDDMLIKSKHAANHIRDLTKTFNILMEQKMNLNASKCIFEVTSGKFLGYLVTQRGMRIF